MVEQDLTLSIDVGTGSVRAALVDRAGAILSIAAEEQHQIVPTFGWAEQSVEGWWSGVKAAIRQVLKDVPDAAQRIAANDPLVMATPRPHGPGALAAIAEQTIALTARPMAPPEARTAQAARGASAARTA